MLETNELDSHFSHVPAPADSNYSQICELKKWLKTRHHLPDISERQISIFLHSCYGSTERTKRTIEKYYTMRTNNQEIFDGRRAEEFNQYLDIIYVYKTPSLSSDGCSVYVFGFLEEDVGKHDVNEAVRLFLSLSDMYTNLNPYSPGWRIVINATGFTIRHFVKFTMAMGTLKKFLSYVQDALPMRLKGVHIIHGYALIGQFLGIIKPFISRDLYNVICVHSSSDLPKLFECIPLDSLPTIAGGKQSLDEMKMRTVADFEKYELWFAADERLGRVDESKREKNEEKQQGWFSGYRRSYDDKDFDPNSFD